jgi:hypothetical protein
MPREMKSTSAYVSPGRGEGRRSGPFHPPAPAAPPRILQSGILRIRDAPYKASRGEGGGCVAAASAAGLAEHDVEEEEHEVLLVVAAPAPRAQGATALWRGGGGGGYRPTQLLTQGQWWSMRSTQRLHVLPTRRPRKPRKGRSRTLCTHTKTPQRVDSPWEARRALNRPGGPGQWWTPRSL